MKDDKEESESLATRLRRRLGEAGRALADVAEDRRILSLFQSEILRGSGTASEVLDQLHQLISVTHLRGVAELLKLEPCSVAIAGPVNVGKSTLVNVLAGEAVAPVSATPGTTSTTHRYEALGFSLIDTPGADESSSIGNERRQLALEAVDESSLTIFLLDATRGVTSSDKAIYDEVIEKLRRPHVLNGENPSAAALAKKHRLLVAINKIDAITRSERESVVGRVSRDLGLPRKSVLQLSALKEQGLDELARRMVDGAPAMAEALAEVMPTYTEELANELIFKHAAVAATVALTPVPMSHVLPLTALQLALVVRLARIYGHEMSWKRSREVLPALAAGIGWRELFRQVVKLVPVTGWALNSGIAYVGTYVTGRTALHLLRTGEKPTLGQLARWRREAQVERKRASH